MIRSSRVNAQLARSALAAVVLTSGCTTRGGDIPYDVANFQAPTVETRGALPSDTPIGPLDKLKVTVFRVPELTGEYQVGADGSVSFPLIGRIDARNQTALELGQQLERQYGERYLAQPDISVEVLTSTQRLVVVEGGVRNPGSFAIPGSSSLLGVLAEADGIDPENGNERRVAIFRRIDGRMKAAAFDVVAIRQGRMSNPDVYPGDLVVVDGARTRRLFRDILSAIPTAALFTNF